MGDGGTVSDENIDDGEPKANEEVAAAEFSHVLDELRRSIGWLRKAAAVVFLVGTIGTTAAVVELPALSAAASKRIAVADDPLNVMIYELLRGAAFAGAVTSILFGVLSLGRACLDQATRFQKRLIAAHFLNFVLHSYDDQLKTGQMGLIDVVTFLKSWSDNVESAFTNVKFGSRNQRTQLTAGAASASTSSGAPDPGRHRENPPANGPASPAMART